MRTRILWNDLKGSPLLAVTTWLFMAVSALMFALTCFLAIGLLGSVDMLMEAAGTPDFLQMHAGEIDEAALVRFAGEQEQVRDYQTLRFLNLENSSIILGGHSLTDSTQDTGALNQSAAQEVMAEFTRLNREVTTILMVTHDSKVAARCGRILYLLDGCIKGEFSPAGVAGEKERETAVSRWLAEMGW